MSNDIESALLSAMPAKVLGLLARLFIQIRPLGWYPGWKFGAGESEMGWFGRRRLALWKQFESKRIQVPFHLRWYDDIRVTIYLGNDLSRCLYVGGTYEPNEFMFLSDVLLPGMTFIDVGANDGLYTLFAAKRLGPQGKVICLEPSEREFGRLRRNIRLNSFTNILPLRIAALDRDGFASFRIAESAHAGQNTLGNFAYPIEQERVIEVPLTTLDAVVEKHSVKHVDFIKIDAEGSELGVLRGARKMLAMHRPLILLELVDAALRHQGGSREAVLTFLESAGYQFKVFGRLGCPEPVASADLDGVNILAVHQDYRLNCSSEGQKMHSIT